MPYRRLRRYKFIKEKKSGYQKVYLLIAASAFVGYHIFAENARDKHNSVCGFTEIFVSFRDFHILSKGTPFDKTVLMRGPMREALSISKSRKERGLGILRYKWTGQKSIFTRRNEIK